MKKENTISYTLTIFELNYYLHFKLLYCNLRTLEVTLVC